MSEDRLAVIAIGGNSLIKDARHQSVEDQYQAVCEVAAHIANVIERGYRVVVTHGNGPQVGFILNRSEVARKYAGIHIIPIVTAVADTQGSIGYGLQQAIDNELRRRGRATGTVTVVTQILVDKDDPGFREPQKFIGEFYTEHDLPQLKKQHPNWIMKADSGRGWRRVVASPKPVRIVELDAVRALLKQGFHVVAAGGGGIPVIEEEGRLRGVPAVIDKDLATAMLAQGLGAHLLCISTAVEQVAIQFGKPDQKNLGVVALAEMERYMRDGQFPPGSMGPKVEGAIAFLKNGGEEVIITNPANLTDAVFNGKGTHIVP